MGKKFSLIFSGEVFCLHLGGFEVPLRWLALWEFQLEFDWGDKAENCWALVCKGPSFSYLKGKSLHENFPKVSFDFSSPNSGNSANKNHFMNFSLCSQYLSTYFPSKKELYYNIFRLFHLLIYLIHEKLLCLGKKTTKQQKYRKKFFFCRVFTTKKLQRNNKHVILLFWQRVAEKKSKIVFCT